MNLSVVAIPIIEAVLQVAVIASLGWILAKRNVLHESATADLSDLVIKLAAPALVFVNASRGTAGLSGIASVVMIVGGPAVLAVGYVVSSGLSRLFRVGAGYRKAVVAASTFQNSAYLPLAVGASMASIVGHAMGLRQADALTEGGIVVDISLFGIIYSPIFWGIGLSWLTDSGGDTPKLLGRPMLVRLLPPPVIGLIAGYIVGLTPLRAVLVPPGAPLHFAFDAVSMVATLTIPMALLVLGAMLARVGAPSSEPARNIGIVLAVRYAITPSLFLAGLWLTRSWWQGSASMAVAAFVLFLQSVTPPATNLAVMTRAGASIRPPDDHTSEAIPRILLVAYAVAMIVLPPWLVVCLRVVGR